ncbi:MAG: blue (type 1) copper domain protein [Gemmatimonadetes bacterium]|nr:blue (type 1) copper domain protein [Gemmatimonadota bacterium]
MTHPIPGARARALALALCTALAAAAPLGAQSTLETTPNLKGTWSVRPGTATFVFAHRFISINGGDQVFNFPTLSFAVGLPAGFSVGAEHATNSEIVAKDLGGNETEYWVRRAFPVGRAVTLNGTAAYNSAAHSADGAVTARLGAGRVSLLGEARGFSNMFGTKKGGFAAAGGAVLKLNRYLGLTGDVGRVLSQDSFPTIWSAGLAFAIPGSPHSVAFYASNASVATLQGTSHPRGIFPEKVRYGFTFTVPLGGPRRWLQIIHPSPEPVKPDSMPAAATRAGPSAAPAASASGDTAAVVEMRGSMFSVREVRVHAGQRVRWVNRDEDVHTVTADDGSWSSPDMHRGDVFARVFDKAGRYPFYCQQHPDMEGVVIVE